MKNRYFRFLAILAVLFSGINVTFAGRVSQEEAAAIAARFTNEQPQLSRMHKAPRQVSNMRLAHKALQNNSEEVAFYVFNQEDGKGFVIVSADDRTAEDVLGYNEHGSFDYSKINPNLKWWLSRYADEITALQTMDDSEFEQPAVRKAKQVTAIPNLLVNDEGKEITWYQESPYNDLCPMDQRDTTRSLTGCVATAASQIMYKWRWPKKGTGSSSYTWYDCKDDNCNQYWTKTLSANYGETAYDWDNMLPAYIGKNYTSAQANAVATLMYHAGVAAKMGYGGDATGGSGAWTDDMGYGLKTYFGYKFDKFITMYSESKYKSAKGTTIADVTCEFNVTTSRITEYFNADLEAGYPIIMGGDGNAGGHEFVCCGRDANNKFYINWGWEGSNNGYFALTALKPGSPNFSSNLDALVGLRPDKKDLPKVTITWSVDGEETTTQIMQEDPLELPDDPANCESGKVFVGWTAQNSVDGEKPADLFKTAAGKTVTEAVTYYAVFATADGEGGEEETTTYTFTSKAWADATNSWTSTKDGNGFDTTKEGVQVTAGVSGAGAKTSKSFNSVSKVVVKYCTNAKDGVGSIAISIGDETKSEDVTKTGGATLRELEFEFSNASGAAAIVVTCTTNSIYVNSVAITAGGGTSYSDYSLSCGAAVECELTGITLNIDNVKKAFTTGDEFTSAGLVVTAKYSNCQDKNKTSKSVVTAPAMNVAGTKDVKVSYTEGDVTKEATYQITVSDPKKYTVTWSVNGKETDVEYVEGKALELPATPANCSDDRIFMGWTASNAVSDKPADLFTTATGNVNADATYYAVYADKEGTGENQVASVTFKTADNDGSSDYSASIRNNLVDQESGISSYSGSKLYVGKEGVKLGTSKANGSITLTLSKEVGVTKVVVNASQYNTENSELKVTAGEMDLGSKSPAQNLEYTATNAVETNEITVETVSGNRAYIASISVVAGGGVSYSNYSLTCGDDPTDVETVQAVSAVQKQLIDGQLFIIRDGQMFTVTGVRIQ